MNERNENAVQILRQLREVEIELRGMRGLRGEVGSRLDGVDVRLEGVAHQLSLLAGHAARLEHRLARIEEDGLAPAR